MCHANTSVGSCGAKPSSYQGVSLIMFGPIWIKSETMIWFFLIFSISVYLITKWPLVYARKLRSTNHVRRLGVIRELGLDVLKVKMIGFFHPYW
jgi:hypothetical protein